MNLRRESSRNYDQITADAEKYILAAIDALNDKQPTSIECKRLTLSGTDDGKHIHIIVDGEPKVVVDLEDDKTSITLSETGESVVLNEKDAEEVDELFISKLHSAENQKCADLLEQILVMPLVIRDLKEAGKCPLDVTPKEILQLVNEKIKSLKED